MAEAKTREQAQAEWWAGWWAQDFSWAGLVGTRVGWFQLATHGNLNGDQNLQEYWRRDPISNAVRDDTELLAAGELLAAPDGKLWHLAHVPLYWADGSPAKADWDDPLKVRLAALVQARLAAGVEFRFKSGIPDGPDGRAQLTGAVLLATPDWDAATPVHLMLVWSWLADWKATGAVFGREFVCQHANFFGGVSTFNGATFAGEANFFEATFAGVADFFGATFAGAATFSGANFSTDARFSRATFSDGAGFTFATFSSRAEFDDATFSSRAGFNYATFCGYTKFSSVTFLNSARFDSAKFEGPLTFIAAKFLGEASFAQGVTWPSKAEHWHQAFFNAQIHNLLDFMDSRLHILAAFDGIRFRQDSALFLDKVPESEAQGQFIREAKLAKVPARSEGLYKEGDYGGWHQSNWFWQRAAYRSAYDERFAQLERGCRALKQEMERQSDKTRAQMFYRFEVQARRRQYGTSWPETAFSYLYAGFSDYGAAIMRPLGALLASVPMMALLYWLIAAIWAEELVPRKEDNTPLYAVQSLQTVREGEAAFNWAPVYGALSFSAQRVFPIGPWEVKAEDDEKDANLRLLLLGKGEKWQQVLIRFIATLHSVFALAMAFLSGIAIRRKFQMD